MLNDQCALLMLGTRTDWHIAEVARAIERRGISVHVLDYLDGAKASVRVDEDGTLAILVNGRPMPDMTLVWHRPKLIPGTPMYPPGKDKDSAHYAAQEWRALYATIAALYDERSINSLHATRCLTKPYQQVLAARAGLRVPRSLLSNDKTDALLFQRSSSDGLVMKSLSETALNPSRFARMQMQSIVTMRVCADDLNQAKAEELTYCPHFFQDEIKKSHELRVVVAGKHCHAFRIHSQDSKRAELDWRLGQSHIRIDPCTLDGRIESALREFMKLSGLFTGSFDLVIDRAGEAWFLECNPSGQWGWLDHLAPGTLVQSFADAFCQRLAELAPQAACA